MRVFKLLFFIFYFFLININYGQSALDSINLRINNAANDSLKFELLYSKVKIYRELELFDSANVSANNMITLAGNDKALRTRAYLTKSTNYTLNNDYEGSKATLLECVSHLNKSDTLQMTKVYDKLAMITYGKADITGSIKYFFKGLEYHKKLGTPLATYRALSILYGQLDDLEKAFFYNQKVIDIAIETKDNKALARAYLSQGYQYKELNKNAKSFVSSNKAAAIYLNDLKDSTNERLNLIYGNIAEVYLYFHKNDIDSVVIINPLFKNVKDLRQSVLDTAEAYIQKSILISEIKNLDHHVFNARSNYGDFYSYKKEYSKALKEYLKSYKACEGKVNMISNEITASNKLVAIYKSLNNPKKALFYLQKNNELQDSLYDDTKKLELGRLEGKLEAESEKKIADLERANQQAILEFDKIKEKAVLESKRKQSRVITYFISIGMLLLLFFTFTINKRLKQTKKQGRLIKKQKDLIEKDRNDIISSIEYSKVIQKKIIPSIKEVKALLPNTFIYFAPKDIVSGDFYWVHKKGNKTYFSVADCTGHGVSGAFMTLISLNLINSIVLEEEIDSPRAILERLNICLKERLSIAKHDKIKHGLDIAMCSYNHDTNEVEYAGIHSPVYIVNKDNELKEIKGDRLFLGISKNFTVTNHTFIIKPGDTIYMCTDGFVDQKGGVKGKKFYYSQLRNTLKLVNEKRLDEREIFLKDKFSNWKGDLEQVDDVCIMGVTF